MSPFTKMHDMTQPIYTWTPSIAPSGLAIYEGELFPDWRGNLFVGALNDKNLKRLVLNKNRAVIREVTVFEEVGNKVRDVRVSPRGEIYIITDREKGAIFRVSTN